MCALGTKSITGNGGDSVSSCVTLCYKENSERALPRFCLFLFLN